MPQRRKTIWQKTKESILVILILAIAWQPLLSALFVSAAQAADEDTDSSLETFDSSIPDELKKASDPDCYTVAKLYYESGVEPTLQDELLEEGTDVYDSSAAVDTTTVEEDEASEYAFAEGSQTLAVEPNDDDSIEPEDTDELPFKQVINLTDLKNATGDPQTLQDITSPKYVASVMGTVGKGVTYYIEKGQNGESDQELVIVCPNAYKTIDEGFFNPLIPISPEVRELADLIRDPSPKIAFTNPEDEFFLLGERCQGGFISPQENWSSTEEDPCPEPNFNIEEDDFIPNGRWDAPKVDQRVIYTLLYLITPSELGGAGREYVRVKQLISKNDGSSPLSQAALSDAPNESVIVTESEIPENSSPGSNTEESGALDNFDELNEEEIDQAPTPDPGSGNPTPTPEPSDESEDSSINRFKIDPNDPPHLPKQLASAVLIDQIDKVRVTTKTTKKRLFGNNSYEYKFQKPFPLEVSWQTDKGLSASTPPDFYNDTTLGSARYNVNRAIVEMLNQWGLGDLELDPSSMDINSFGDIALLVGKSLLERSLGTPTGSLKGWDLASTLDSIGRAYLEQDLNLVPGALEGELSSFEDIVQNIGRATMEYALGLAKGSLKTKNGTSEEILSSIGRRYLENEVFKVSENTLLPSEKKDSAGNVVESYPLQSVGDLLERLGEGRIEYVFHLPKQSLRTPNYKQFRESSQKAGLLFPSKNSAPRDSDYDMSDYLTNSLGLSFVTFNTIAGIEYSMYGFRRQHFAMPAIELEKNGAISGSSDDALKLFKRLVGSKVVENGIGVFHHSGQNDRVLTEVQNNRTGAGNNNPIYIGTTEWCNERRTEFLNIGMGINLDTPCATETVNPQSNEVQLLKHLKEILNTDEIIYRQVYDPAGDTPPNPADYASRAGLGEDGLPEDRDDRRAYNLAEVMFYGSHLRQTPTNVVFSGAPSDNNPNGTHIDDPCEMDNTAGTVKNAAACQTFREFFAGDTGLNSAPFQADPTFARRLAMLGELLGDQYQNNNGQLTDYFDLLPLKDLSGDPLDREIIARLNALTRHPAKSTGTPPDPNQFINQYNNKSYNGWIYLLQDLKSRLECLKDGSRYEYNPDLQVFDCRATGQEVSGDTIDKYDQAIEQIDGLLAKANTQVSALIAILDTGGAAMDSLTFEQNGSLSQTALQGQSAMSAAIGLPGQLYEVNENGEYAAGSFSFNRDPMRALLAPGYNAGQHVDLNAGLITPDSYLRQIGLITAARKFSDDPLAQRTMINRLRTDLPDFASAVDNFMSLGLGADLPEEKGLLKGDFGLIFQLNSAGTVFERVGKQELMRVIWEKSNAKKLTNSEDYRRALSAISTVTQTLSFYRVRVEELAGKGSQKGLVQEWYENVEQLIGLIDSAQADIRTNLQQTAERVKIVLKDVRDKKKLKTNSIAQLQVIGRDFLPFLAHYQAIIKDVNNNDSNTPLGGKLQEVREKTDDIIHTISEIMAGKALPRAETFSGQQPDPDFSNPDLPDNECFRAKDLLTVITQGRGMPPGNLSVKIKQLQTQLQSFALYVGSCKIDRGLSLPKGTIYTWYSLGHKQYPPAGLENRDDLYQDDPNNPGQRIVQEDIPEWNNNNWDRSNFQLSAGVSYYLERGERINLDDIENGSLNGDEIKEFMRQGRQIIEFALMYRLSKLVPGFRKFARHYQLTGYDMMEVLMGNMRPLISKVGGTFIDEALGLPLGTGSELIYPSCFDPSGNAHPCNNEPGVPGSDPNNLRLQTLANVGLQKLGLELPQFPLNIDLLAGRNPLTAWGNARVSEYLELETNSFTGKVNDPPAPPTAKYTNFSGNATENLNAAFNLQENPFARAARQINDQLGSRLREYINRTPAGMSSILSTVNTRRIKLTELNAKLDDKFSEYYRRVTFQRIYERPDYWFFARQSDLTAAARDLANADARTFFNFSDSNNQGFLNALWDLVQSYAEYLNQEEAITLKKILAVKYGEIGPEYTAPDSSFDYTQATYTLKANPGTDYLNHYANNYVLILEGLRRRVGDINSELGLAAGNLNNGDLGAFGGFLSGFTAAETIANTVGVSEAATSLADQAVNDYIDENAPTWLKSVNDGTKLYTEANCGRALGIGGLLSETLFASSGSSTSSCSGFQSVGQVNTADILYNDNYQEFRLFLFEKLLSRTFNAEFEERLGIEIGTFRSIAARPNRAGAILTEQGVLLSANKIFGKDTANQACPAGQDGLNSNIFSSTPKCRGAVIKNALKEAYLAAFYDPVKGEYTTRFSGERALSHLESYLNQEIDRELSRAGRKYIGAEITRADISLLFMGDGSYNAKFFEMLALQYSVNRINIGLDTNENTKNHPRKDRFKITYDEVRAAVGLESPSLERSYFEARRANNKYVKNTVCSSDADLCDTYDQAALETKFFELEKNKYNDADLYLPGGELEDYAYWADYDENGTVNNEEADRFQNEDQILVTEHELENQSQAGAEIDAHDRRVAAQTNLKYKTLDAAAFLYDQSIPVHFSGRLFSGNLMQQSLALGEYMFNVWAKNDSGFRKFCESAGIDPDMLGNLSVQLVDALVSGSDRNNKLQAIFANPDNSGLFDSLDQAFSTWLSRVFKIVNPLPNGLLKGLYGWIATGARDKDFFNRNLCVGGSGSNCSGGSVIPSAGRVLLEYGENALAGWLDRQWKMEPGTGQKIINAAKAVVEVYNYSKVGKVNIFGGNYEVVNGKKQVTKNGQLKAAAFNIMLDLFVNDVMGEAFMKMDQNLGLPPGTVGQVVSIGLTATAMALGIIPFDLTSLAVSAVLLISNLVWGVTKVINESIGTADGYYPWHNYGYGEAAGRNAYPNYPEYRTSDPSSGEFDVAKYIDYRDGLKLAARTKVTGILTDILNFPNSDFAKTHGFKPNEVWIPQIFTYGDQEYDPRANPYLSGLINRYSRWDPEAGEVPEEGEGAGYGFQQSICEDSYSTTDGTVYCIYNSEQSRKRAGVFPDIQLYNAVYFAW